MKTLIYAALIAGVLATPVASFAQDTTGPLTRAELRADLIQAEHAGYRPAAYDVNYPADIQAAEARVQAQDVTAPGSTGAGGVSDGSSQADAPTVTGSTHSIYFGHSRSRVSQATAGHFVRPMRWATAFAQFRFQRLSSLTLARYHDRPRRTMYK
ncbi:MULTISPECIES: DUF4148 domain-containing protein [unclassified Paraburkholderia]|uniref:DUF4148 domain-containing protein n=1 Tax=unclassified Paraburkholderia TaxID=2615204 RepID=UPI0038BB77AC